MLEYLFCLLLLKYRHLLRWSEKDDEDEAEFVRRALEPGAGIRIYPEDQKKIDEEFVRQSLEPYAGIFDEPEPEPPKPRLRVVK